MNYKTLNEMGGALRRIAELQAKKIIEKDDASELRALEAYVQSALRENANELLASWVTVENEFKPLVQGFSSLLGYAAQIVDRKNAARQAPAAADADADAAVVPGADEKLPENVVQLKAP